MPITNRTLPAGTVLAGRYKGQTYRCTVLEHEGTSPSRWKTTRSTRALGRSLEDHERGQRERLALLEPRRRPAREGSEGREAREDEGRRHEARPPDQEAPNQKGVPEGMTKFHCSACMESFLSETEPETCPAGHPRETADEFAATPKDAASAD
ncbi:MAG: hypothetical protein M5U18_08330 [Dehalococcoidia bacterium]|nr:hypothetical protein [Dehalococcoidia bacterium]